MVPTQIALLRGINLGASTTVKMAPLRELCESLGMKNVRTYIQSGNIVFESNRTDEAPRLADAIAKEFNVKTFAVIRTREDLEQLTASNPYPTQDPKKVVVVFLTATPSPEAIAAVEAMQITPEQITFQNREMIIYFPNGQGVSKLPIAKIERTLKVAGTGRNWNTVQALLAL
jgi:uncharacterized protein (DUF1697 family)